MSSLSHSFIPPLDSPNPEMPPEIAPSSSQRQAPHHCPLQTSAGQQLGTSSTREASNVGTLGRDR